MKDIFNLFKKISEKLLSKTDNKVEIFCEEYPVHLQNKKNSKTYELCLKTKNLPHFKYRFMFIEYLDNDLRNTVL